MTTTEAPPPPPPPTTTTPPPDPCAVNLTAPRSRRTVSELPRDRAATNRGNPVPVAGNYNECAQLSAVIIKANTNAAKSNTRAVMFHLGKFIPTGVPDPTASTASTPRRAPATPSPCPTSNGLGMQSVVKFRWNGNGVDLIGNG